MHESTRWGLLDGCLRAVGSMHTPMYAQAAGCRRAQLCPAAADRLRPSLCPPPPAGAIAVFASVMAYCRWRRLI